MFKTTIINLNGISLNKKYCMLSIIKNHDMKNIYVFKSINVEKIGNPVQWKFLGTRYLNYSIVCNRKKR